MKCAGCNWSLTALYVKYNDWRGEPLCQNCYITQGGKV